jgi:hypothetical protein
LEIGWPDRRFTQNLDYLGIPFRCSICHKTGHLRRNCSGRFDDEDVSEDTTLHKDLVDSEEEGLSTWNDHSIPRTSTSLSLPLEMFVTGKLQLYYPTLYYSLSLMEKSMLNASPIFLSLLTSEEPLPGKGLDDLTNSTIPPTSLSKPSLLCSGVSVSLHVVQDSIHVSTSTFLPSTITEQRLNSHVFSLSTPTS